MKVNEIESILFEMPDTGEFKLVTGRKKRASSVRNNCDLNVPLPNNDGYESDSDANYETLYR